MEAEGTTTITPEQIRQLHDFTAFTQNSASMNEIVRQMKEIPELPSEVPNTKENGEKDVNPLEKVEFPEAGGVLTYMGGHEYPYKGFPFFEFVDKIDMIKKIQRATLSSVYHSMRKRNKLQVATLILVPWIFGDIVRAYIYTFHRLVERFRIKSIRYSDSVRELYRVFSPSYRDEPADQKEMRNMIRDIVCMVLEFDNAYRFRFQDVIVELDKARLKKNPSKEIIRLLNVMSSREKTQEIKDTWKLVKYFLPVYFFINNSFKRNIVDVLNDLDLQKVKLSVEDEHYCKERKDYSFGFQLNEHGS